MTIQMMWFSAITMASAGALAGVLVAGSAGCETGPALLDLSENWRFRACPERAGACKDWMNPGFEDGEWALRHASRTERSPAGAGVRTLWCRKQVVLDRPWSRVFLALSGVAGRADIFVDGHLVAENLTRPHQGTRQMVRELTAAVGSSTSFLLALKLSEMKGGDGPGFDPEAGTPVLLAREARGLFIEQAGWHDYLAQEYPELPWPAWARGKGSGWMPIAPPRSGGPILLMGREGQLEPVGRDFAVSTWLYYPASGRLYCLETISSNFELAGGYLPLPRVSAKAGRWFNLFLRSWVQEEEASRPFTVGIGEVTIENTLDRTRELELIVAVHPFGPKSPPHAIRRVDFDPDSRVISVNGRPAVVLRGSPDVFCATGFSESGGTIARLFAKGEFPSSLSAADPLYGLASCGAVYRFRIQPYGARTQTFRILPANGPERVDPEMLESIGSIKWKKSRQAAESAWRKALLGRGRMMLRVPNKRAQEAFYASVGYLLMAVPGEESEGSLDPLSTRALAFAGHGGPLAGSGPALSLTIAGSWAGEPTVPVDTTVSVGTTASAEAAGAVFAVSGNDSPWCSAGLCSPAESLRRARLLLAQGNEDEAARIVDWCLAHQVPAGSHSWPEVMDPGKRGYVMGASPDLEAAAHYVCLMREMLLAEKGSELAITPGVPSAWVKPGSALHVHYVPTRFGIIAGFSVVSSPRELALRVYSLAEVARVERMRMPAQIVAVHPPAGYLWKVPGNKPMARVLVDGRVLKELPADRWLKLPPGVKRAKVVW